MNTAMNIEVLPLLHLLQLSSPTLPIGGFAWSQGLESAIEQDWLKDEHDLARWLDGILQQSFVWQEWPLLIRCFTRIQMMSDGQETSDCIADSIEWNRVSLALRETAELRQEDVQMGTALLRLMSDLGYTNAHLWNRKFAEQEDISYVMAFAMAAREKQVPLTAAAMGFAWGWLENQIAAALKLFPLGQTAGQRVFHQLVGKLEQYWLQAQQVSDEEIGLSLPGVALASMHHEQQYSRLFRS